MERTSSVSRRAAVVTLALLAVAACANVLGIQGSVTVSDRADASASASACGLPIAAGACEACIATSCCAQATACAASEGCGGYESCLLSCGGDFACRSRCELTNPAPDTITPSVDQCVAVHCTAACGSQCGVSVTGTDPDASAGCARCIVAGPCGSVQACETDLACAELAHCEGQCATLDCQSACMIELEAGVGLAVAAESALAESCLTACQYGAHWACLGRNGIQSAKAPTIQLQLIAKNLVGGGIVPNVTVLACEPIDNECAMPLASAKTGPDGTATLSIPTPTAFIGHLVLTAPGYVPGLYFFAYDLTEPNSLLPLSLITEAALAAAVSAANVTLDPTLGTVAVQTYDCQLQGASNVAVAATGAGSKATLLYAENTLLSAQATATQGSNIALVVNAQPGTVGLTATPLAVGSVSSTASVLVQPGALSYVALVPN